MVDLRRGDLVCDEPYYLILSSDPVRGGSRSISVHWLLSREIYRSTAIYPPQALLNGGRGGAIVVRRDEILR